MMIKADTTTSPAHCCLYHYVHSSRDSFQFYLKKRKNIQLLQQKCRRGPVNKTFLSLEI